MKTNDLTIKKPLRRMQMRAMDQVLDVRIMGIDDEMKHDLIRFFSAMQMLGAIGASRMLMMFVDGDGAARPRVFIDGEDIPVEFHVSLDDFEPGRLEDSEIFRIGLGA